MINKILFLCQSLISIPSTKDNPLMLKKIIEVAKEELRNFTVEYFEKKQYPIGFCLSSVKKTKKV